MDKTVDLTSEFAAADVVVITDNLNRRLATRSEPGAIAGLRALLVGLVDGWHVPLGGVPVAPVRLNFRCDDDPVGNLGVGATFLTAHVHGTFLARNSDMDTATRLFEALGAGSLINRMEGR